MRPLAAFLLPLLLLFLQAQALPFGNGPSLAEPDTEAVAPRLQESYLQSSDPYLTRIAQLNSEFLATVPDLQKKRDLLGMQKTVTKLNGSWVEIRTGLSGLAPPSECEAYHAALGRMVEVQLACNALLLETVNKGLALTAEIKTMKASGATEETMKARIAEFAAERQEIAQRLASLKGEAQALDETLRSERERLEPSSP